jgi:hypothetical protein
LGFFHFFEVFAWFMTLLLHTGHMSSIAPETARKANKNGGFPVVLRKGGVVVRIFLSVYKQGYNQYTGSYLPAQC